MVKPGRGRNDMPGKVADFLRATELEPAERAALDHGVIVRRGQGYTLRVSTTPAVHRALLGRWQALDGTSAVPAQHKAAASTRTASTCTLPLRTSAVSHVLLHDGWRQLYENTTQRPVHTVLRGRFSAGGVAPRQLWHCHDQTRVAGPTEPGHLAAIRSRTGSSRRALSVGRSKVSC